MKVEVFALEEIWKPIVGYEGLYEISNFGRVKSLPKQCGYRKSKERIMKLDVNKDGYLLASLYKNNKSRKYQVHRLVAKAFIPNPKNKPQVDHINRIRADNRIENLRWVYPYENSNNACYNKIIEYKGDKKTVAEWARFLDMKNSTLHNRLNIHNWSVEKSFTYPIKKRTVKPKQILSN